VTVFNVYTSINVMYEDEAPGIKACKGGVGENIVIGKASERIHVALMSKWVSDCGVDSAAPG
jgi:hypothetical protein